MSFLEKKNKSLYAQKKSSPGQVVETRRREEFYVKEKSGEKSKEFLEENEIGWWKFFPTMRKKKVFLWGQTFLFGLLFILGGVFLFIRYQEGAFSESRLLLNVSCSDPIVSGEELVCQIVMENNNRIDLEATVLRLNYSNELELKSNDLGLSGQDLKFGQVSLGTFAAGEKKAFHLNFEVFGSGGSQIFLENTLRYKLSNFGVIMEKKSQFSSFISTSPLAAILVSAGEVATDEIIEFQAIVKNEGRENFSDLFLQAEYPSGFSFMESSSADLMAGDNIWNLGNLMAGEQKTISFRGKVAGTPSASKEIKIILNRKKDGQSVKQAEATKLIKIIAPRIELKNLINDKENFSVASPGQTLSFKIVFKNNSDRPLRDLILKEKINGTLIDEEKTNLLGKGFYDSQNKEIIWKASDLKDLEVLEPGQSGQVSFLVYLKNDMSMVNSAQINPQIFYQSEIESLDINSPLGENKKVVLEEKSLKINSVASLELSGTKEDQLFASFGAWPLEEGVETSVVLKLKLKNSFNDLKNATVRMAFPSRVSWKNNYRQSAGEVSFNERDNELIWKLGDIKAGTGYYLTEDSLFFQIGVTPSKNDTLKDLIKIVNDWQLTAEDVFTNQWINQSFSNFTVGRLEGI